MTSRESTGPLLSHVEFVRKEKTTTLGIGKQGVHTLTPVKGFYTYVILKYEISGK